MFALFKFVPFAVVSADCGDKLFSQINCLVDYTEKEKSPASDSYAVADF